MNEKEKTTTSKLLSLILRHDPGRFGVELDPAGWTPVEALLAGCAKAGRAVTRGQLEEIVATNDKKRFILDESGMRIRANQGHSVEVDLGHETAMPPPVLFHGTAERNLPSIRAQGLIKGQRHHVHLSLDEKTASAVGQRYGRPVVLRVAAAEMAEAGHTFYVTPNNVWLVAHVPARFITLP